MQASAAPATVSSEAAAFIAALDTATLPPDVLEKARTCVLYGYGIGLLCLKQETARVAEASVCAIDGESAGRGATSLVGGRRVSVSAAVFANAVLLHSRCQEDTSGTAHLGVVVLSVAMALVESGLASGEELLPGIVAGYEVAGALEAALGRETMANALRASPLYGTVAAAATAARMLRLPLPQIDAALANAAGFTGGTLQSIPEGSDEWRYQVGVAARTGLLAAMLAQQGSVSARHAIEGPQGFIRAFAGRGMKPGEFSFGSSWSLRNVTFKPYPVCAHNQTVAMIGASVHQRFPPQQIGALRLRISSYVVPGLLARGPFQRVPDTLMSAAFCCACACVYGTVSMEKLESFDDPAILAMIERIVIEPDDAVAYPAAVAEITLRDGSTVALAEQRRFTDFSFGRAAVVEQLLRLAAEEDIPARCVELLDGCAFAAQPRPAAIEEAFSVARRSVEPAGQSLRSNRLSTEQA
jgi:2-methylcitrate dehydratase PrpD